MLLFYAENATPLHQALEPQERARPLSRWECEFSQSPSRKGCVNASHAIIAADELEQGAIRAEAKLAV